MSKADHLKQYRFEKGKSGNESGRPAIPKHLKDFRRISYEDFLNALQANLNQPKEYLNDKLRDPQAPAFELIVIKIILGCIGDGKYGLDKDARNILLERLWGKVPDVSQIYQENTAELLNDIPRENILEYLRKAKAE